MISSVCSTAVLATNMDTGDRRVLQHSNTAHCEHGTLDRRHHMQGIWNFQIIYTVSFTVCIQQISTLSVSTHHTQKPANKKLRSPAQRGDLATKIDYETHYLHGIVQLLISLSIGSITVLYILQIQTLRAAVPDTGLAGHKERVVCSAGCVQGVQCQCVQGVQCQCVQSCVHGLCKLQRTLSTHRCQYTSPLHTG